MIGVSLPLPWLCGAPHALGDVPAVLTALRERGVSSVELRSVAPHTPRTDVDRVATLLWAHGFSLTVHSSVRACETAVEDVFSPLTDLLAHLLQPRLTLVLHPIAGDNVAMLHALAAHAAQHAYPITFALENNRLLPDHTEGDSTAAVLRIVEQTALPCVGICFDVGHHWYFCKRHHTDAPCPPLPSAFLRRVVHTHIHALDGLRTHFPLDSHEQPPRQWLDALSYGYFGVYNIELDFPRFSDIRDAREALFGSVETLRLDLPFCARLYHGIRTQFDERMMYALRVLEDTRPGTRFSLIHATSYLFNTGGFRWAMDVSLRTAYSLAQTPHRIAELLAPLELMIITHDHADHFEERTVRALAANRLRWVVPDFLVDKAVTWGIPRERILTAVCGRALRIGPLTVLPFAGRHIRPTTGKGIAACGYHIRTDEGLSLAFPADVRDFSLTDLPDLPPADYCFAHVWLGDREETAAEQARRREPFARFMLRFSQSHLLFTHLYENGRRYEDMWRHEHAEQLADMVHRLSPHTATTIPEAGETMALVRQNEENREKP